MATATQLLTCNELDAILEEREGGWHQIVDGELAVTLFRVETISSSAPTSSTP
jgi:hypothetical protein